MANLNDLKAALAKPELAHKQGPLKEWINQLEGFASRTAGLSPDQWAQLFQLLWALIQILHPTPNPTPVPPAPAMAPKPPPGPAPKK